MFFRLSSAFVPASAVAFLVVIPEGDLLFALVVALAVRPGLAWGFSPKNKG
jgi:hypothetical protein